MKFKLIPQSNLSLITKVLYCGFFILITNTAFCQESKLKFSELNIGLDYRTATYKILVDKIHQKYSEKNYNESWTGITSKLQSSFVAEYMMKNTQKSFKYGDLIGGEIGLGYINSDSTGNSIRFNYRFDFGFGFTKTLNQNHEFGMNFYILKFINEGIVPNGSGSSIVLRYRFNKLILESCLDSHRQRIVGWITGLDPKNNVTLQAGCSIKYNLENDQQIGIRYEQMPVSEVKHIDKNQESQSRFAFRIFYGIIF